MMLRFVQGPSNSVLKQRVSNNFVQQASRNYLHPTQQTSFITQQRTYTSQQQHQQQQQQQTATLFGKKYSSKKKLTKNADKQQQMRTSNVQKHLTFREINTTSEFYENFKEFDNYIIQSLQISTQQSSSLDMNGRTKQSFQFQKNPLYWDSVTQSMKLYRIINKSKDFGPERLSSLIHLLHNGLRINRFQLARMSKKPDYDSSSFHKQITNFIYESLKEISDDILNSNKNADGTGYVLKVNEFGLMHLITCFKELLLEEEAVEIWNKGLQQINNSNLTPSEIQNIKSVYLNSKVVGTVLPLLNDQGLPFEESYKLYKESMSLSSPTQYSNLILGMLLVCLKMGANKKALDLFSDLFSIAQKNNFGYLIEAHLAFIGECKDLNVANDFFMKAINGEMPYKVDLQVSFVKKFMNNTWTITKDFNQVYNIWLQASKFYGSYVHHGISSSLNDEFFNIFFEAHDLKKMSLEQGFSKLQNVITTYNSIKQIDEPFFNIILSKASSTWKDYKIVEFIDNSYSIYNTKKTIIAYRILLKSLGSIDNISKNEILNKWNDLLQKSDESGQTYIANADWAALRDSTLTWSTEKLKTLNLLKQQAQHAKQVQQDKAAQQLNETSNTQEEQLLTPPVTPPPSSPVQCGKFESNDTELDYNPALQALKESGAFENESSAELNSKMNEQHHLQQQQELNTVTNLENQVSVLEEQIRTRIDTYWAVFFQYSKFCRDLNQLKKLSNGYVRKFAVLEPFLSTSKHAHEHQEITTPQFVNLKSFNDSKQH